MGVDSPILLLFTVVINDLKLYSLPDFVSRKNSYLMRSFNLFVKFSSKMGYFASNWNSGMFVSVQIGIISMD